MCVCECSAVGCFSHAAALLWFPSAKSGLQRFSLMNVLPCVSLAVSAVAVHAVWNSKTDKYLSF